MKNILSKELFKGLIDPSYLVLKNAMGIREDGQVQKNRLLIKVI